MNRICFTSLTENILISSSTTATGSSGTREINIYEGDIIVFNGRSYVKLPKELKQLEAEYIYAERAETALSLLLDSGELSREGESIVKTGLGFKENK